LDLPTQESAKRLLEGLNLVVTIDGNYYEILPEEVEVHSESQIGFSVAADGPYLAALDTTMTKELELEGLSREFVRHVQSMRKDAGFEISDRIWVRYQATEDLNSAIESHRDFIMSETLALKLESGEGDERWVRQDDEFDGNKLSLYIRKPTLVGDSR
jgi:isoleucyl-tRNA synthetase